MKNKLKIGVILGIGLLGANCSLSLAKAESNQAEKPALANEIVSEQSNKQSLAPKKTPTLSAASVIGTYERDTEKDGEGYDNSLEITKADDGKLFIIFQAAISTKWAKRRPLRKPKARARRFYKAARLTRPWLTKPANRAGQK